MLILFVPIAPVLRTITILTPLLLGASALAQLPPAPPVETPKNNQTPMTIEVASASAVNANPGYEHVETFRLSDIDTYTVENMIDPVTGEPITEKRKRSASFSIAMNITSGYARVTFPSNPMSTDADGNTLYSVNVVTEMDDLTAEEEIYYDEATLTDTATDTRLVDPTVTARVKVIVKPNV